jgi:hypothetical protein
MHWFSRKLKNVECMLKKWKDNLEGDYPEMILLVASMFGSSLVVKIHFCWKKNQTPACMMSCTFSIISADYEKNILMTGFI